MKIIADSNIPFLAHLADVEGVDAVFLPAAEITPEVVRDADALIIRTRTVCDEALLGGSRCRFIGTATIGTDHIDLPYCASRGIQVANAPGCNAPAVAQYVLRAIAACGLPYDEVTLGIIGLGNVGRILKRWAESLGMKVLANDPPRALAEGQEGFVGLERIAEECNVVTVHTPLTRDGQFPTYHLIDSGFLTQLKRRPLVVNAARGPVTDTAALLGAMDCGLVSQAAIDCWEGEPRISAELLSRAAVSTPHIAGYSFQGKVRATAMVLEALAQHFGIPSEVLMSGLPAIGSIPKGVIVSEIALYDIMADSSALKASPGSFERLRNTYKFRSEPGS